LVTKHWPEFGANGKDTITVADVMRHAGGVPLIVDPNSKTNYPHDTILITPQDVFGVEPLDQLISEAERYPNSSTPQLAYHAHTRGWIVDGILRRVDPFGRSLGQFLKEEITDPLSKTLSEDVKFFCGIPREDQANHKFASISKGSDAYNLAMLILPSLAGFGDPSVAETVKLLLGRKDVRKQVVSWIETPLPSLDYIDSPEGRSMEYPSAGMMANARSMALINATAMAGDGSWDGLRLLSPEGVAHSFGDVVTRTDQAMDLRYGLSRGGYGSFKDIDCGSYHGRIFHPVDNEAYVNLMGWGGIGGSLSLVDRKRDISFAYCMNAFGLSMLGGARTRRILLALQKVMAE